VKYWKSHGPQGSKFLSLKFKVTIHEFVWELKREAEVYIGKYGSPLPGVDISTNAFWWENMKKRKRIVGKMWKTGIKRKEGKKIA
jgi:hypothetical protein